MAAAHVGINPLPPFDYELGKGAHKVVQYFAFGLPVVASPVGMSSDIVVSGENGYLASTEEQWVDALQRLLLDQELRQRLGEGGQRLWRERVTPEVTGEQWLDVFASLSEGA